MLEKWLTMLKTLVAVLKSKKRQKKLKNKLWRIDRLRVEAQQQLLKM